MTTKSQYFSNIREGNQPVSCIWLFHAEWFMFCRCLRSVVSVGAPAYCTCSAECLETVRWAPCDHIALFSLIRTLVTLRLVCRIRSNSRGCEASSRQDGEAGLHPPPVNWDVWKPGQHRHGSGQLASESVHGHHIRSPDCHDMSSSVKAFSGSLALVWPSLCGHLSSRSCHRRIACVPGRHEFDTGCSAEAR